MRGLTIILAIMMCACGGGRRSTAAASCTVTASLGGFSSMSCFEYATLPPGGADTIRMACPPPPATLPDAGTHVATSYTFVELGCVISGAVGGCQNTIAGTSTTTWYYDSALVPTFMQLCSQQAGTWVTPPP